MSNIYYSDVPKQVTIGDIWYSPTTRQVEVCTSTGISISHVDACEQLLKENKELQEKLAEMTYKYNELRDIELYIHHLKDKIRRYEEMQKPTYDTEKRRIKLPRRIK